ncbi:MAG: 16S rRNA processing protein RimM [Candidatus Coatesbacteria bacterium]|nr:16S rRNA processing protein RimM [Candidatus Coatesbacteria bacterium]
MVSQLESLNPAYCTIGRIVKTHGIRGEVKITPMTDFPERFVEREVVFLEPPFEPLRMIVSSIRAHKDSFLVKFEGVDTMSDAANLVNKFVRIPEAELEPLEEGAFYWHQLEGLRVLDESEGEIGNVESVFRAGESGNEILVVIGKSGERLVPMIEEVVLDVDLDSGVIRTRLPEGM